MINRLVLQGGPVTMAVEKGKKLLWTNLLSGFSAWFWVLISEYTYENVDMFVGNTTNQLLLLVLGGIVYWFTLTRMLLMYEFRSTEGSHKRALIVYTAIILIYGIIKFIF